jgi:2-polyprenyl-3-methyl-5-hydroxy-6-metoxy-1,4-benzoquinol methylase
MTLTLVKDICGSAAPHTWTPVAHPERIDPNTTESGILAIHLKRYEFGSRFCGGAEVLDAACGLGYGTAYLAQSARRVRGVDASPDAVAAARERYSGPNVDFRVADVMDLPDAEQSYDVACSFETIEHVERPEAMLTEIARVLRRGGVLVVSTPNAPKTTNAPANPYHRTEWSANDFELLLRRFFLDVEMHSQRRVQTAAHRLAQRLDVLGLRRRMPSLRRGARLLGSAPTAELTLDDVLIEPGVHPRATELVAVCRSPRV